jgi:hypothetical protein
VTVKIGGTEPARTQTTSCGTLSQVISSVGTRWQRRRGDQALAAEDVGERAGERRGERDRHVAAVISELISPALTLKSCDSLGSRACGE